MASASVATDNSTVLDAALAQNSSPYMLPSDQVEIFQQLTRREGAHHGIQNNPTETGYKNQVTVHYRGTALVIEIRTTEQLNVA